MTWLDRAIGWVSPAAGLRRLQARAVLRMVRAYEGANVTRRTVNWKTSGASANAEIASGLARLRARSRDLVRNNPYARRAIAGLVGNSVGTGITLGLKNKQAGKLWKQWLKEADFFGEQDLYGVQALTARAGFESGDCLIIRVRVPAAQAGKSGVPLKIKVLEGDFLDVNKHGPQANGNSAVAGVEIDPEGRKVAYWIYPIHPGETYIFQPRIASVRVLAEDVIYHFEKERPGQVLGVPRLASGIMRIRDLDEYQDAVIVKKKIEACFAAFVSSDSDNPPPVGAAVETETDSNGNERRIERMEPGQIMYGKTGESIEFGTPTSGPEVGFVADQLRAIAAGVGVTYEQLTGDLSSVNYSSMRGGRAEFKLLVEQYRWHTFVPQVLERIYGWFEEAAYLAGKIRTTEHEHVWTAPRWEYVNPKEDVETTLLELDAGLTSHSAVIRERGEDFDQVVEEIAADRETLDKAKVKVVYSKSAAPAAEATPAKDAKPDANKDESRVLTAIDGLVDQVHRRIDGLQGETRGGCERLSREISASRSEPPAPPNINVTTPPVNVTIAEGAVRHESHVEVQPASVQVTPKIDVHTPAPARVIEETIHRDENREISRITRETKE